MLNGNEGILTLDSDSFRARLYILKIGIRPLNYHREAPDLLRYALLKQKLLTESQLQNIFSTWVPGTSYPGDYLINRRILSPETVHGELRKQIESFIYQMFLTPNLNYEFLAGEDSTDYELFSPTGLGKTLIYNTNRLLMETVRREDEWGRFQQTITSRTEIFVLNEAVTQESPPIGVPEENLLDVRSLINGELSVEQIVEESTLSEFEIYEILFRFRERDAIRPLRLEEKQALADRLRNSLRPKDALTIYKSILLNEPPNVEIREKLIDLLVKNKAPENELIEHYLYLASLFEDEDPDQATDHLKKAVDIAPNNVAALDKLFDLHTKLGRHCDALAIAHDLIAMAKEEIDSNVAVNLLYKFINFYPEEVALFHELAAILATTDNVSEAVECLKSVAEIYQRRNDYQELRRTYEKIVSLRPSEHHKLKKIRELEKRSKRSKGYLIKFTSVALVAGLLFGFGILAGITELCSRKVYAQIRTDVSTLTKLKDYDRAKKVLGDFIKVFPISTTRRRAHALGVELVRLQQEHKATQAASREQRRFVEQTKLARAKIRYKDKDYSTALTMLMELDTKNLRSRLRREAASLKFEIKKYFATAQDLAERAQHAFDRGEYTTSHRLRKAILYRFPHSEAARELRLPVYVETLPPGVEILVDDKHYGKSPLPVLFDPAKNPPRVILYKPGYKAYQLDNAKFNDIVFNPIEMPRVMVRLDKAVAWNFDSGDGIECSPATLKDRVFFGNRNGTVHCVDLKTGKKLFWKFQTEFTLDIKGGIGTWNNLVYFGSTDGSLYVVNGLNGSLKHRVKPFDGAHPIKEAASRANERGVTFVNCGGQAIAAIKLSSGEELWSQAYPRHGLLGQPAIRGDSIYIAARSGSILKLSQANGNTEDVFVVSKSEILFQGTLVGSRMYVVDVQNAIHAFDVERMRRAWTHNASQPPNAPVTAGSDHVVVPLKNRAVLGLNAKGEKLWQSAVGRPIVTHGILFKNTYISGTTDGRIVCVDVNSGSLLWKYRTRQSGQTGFVVPGTVDKGQLFLGSQDGVFYCLPLD